MAEGGGRICTEIEMCLSDLLLNLRNKGEARKSQHLWVAHSSNPDDAKEAEAGGSQVPGHTRITLGMGTREDLACAREGVCGPS